MVIAEREAAEQVKVPTRATVLLCAWRSLLAETAECMLQLRDRGWGYVIKRGDALISRSRSIVVSNWYKQTDEDVFLMIDDDVVFLPEHAERVVEVAREKRGIACAAYPVKDGTHLACRRFPGQVITFGEGSQPVEIVYPATGFMAVHRDVIDAMIEAKNPDGSLVFPLCDAHGLTPMWTFFDTFIKTGEDGRSEYLSEDYAFGERARQLGFDIWLDPSVILYHMGVYPYTIENMKGVQNFEAEEQPIGTIDGFKMFLPKDDQIITQDIRLQGFWDEDTRDAIKAHLKPGWTFLDLGAHAGYFSLLAASMGNKVIAVEPMPEMAELWRKNINVNGFTDLARLDECAVSDEDGTSGMVRNSVNTGAAYRVLNGLGDLGVDTKRLSQVLNWAYPEFLKVDIEGDEYRVLAANPDVLDRAQAIVIEICEPQLQRNSGVGEGELLELLTNAGFSMSRLHGRAGYADWLGLKEGA